MDNVELFSQSAIKIKDGLVIYFDPYNIDNKYNDADIVFITHSHYDHYSPKDIDLVKKDDTIFVVPSDLEGKFNNEIVVIPNKSYEVKGINFSTIPAYNINKPYHKREYNWVGYIVNLSKIYYVAGDTDLTEESKLVHCDIAFLPIGGTYTMDYKEASELANIIKPIICIPTHYYTIVGTKEDALKFKELNNGKTVILMKE
jgi:L-ascorbate metabolism protein UlaG (beta-lactamase superfamily)